MPLAERDSNSSARNSRASMVSLGSRGLPPKGSLPSRNDLFSAPGVASMLRTSTELGNLGGIGTEPSSIMMPNVPRAPPRSGAASRMSTGSSHSNNSRRDSRPRSAQHHAWPSASSGPRHSMTRNVNMPDYIADTLSPTIMNLPGSSPLIPHSSGSRDSRTRSMTHASHPNLTLTSNRSYSSLRTQDFGQRPHSPFDGYAQHFRRSGGMRPVSPAVSDYTDSRPRRWPGDHSLTRSRGPPDMSTRRGQRGQMMLPMMPHRRGSPAYYANPEHHAGIPPVPQIPAHHRHRIASHNRITPRPVRAPGAFGNQRMVDPDAPSSDEPSPPTPKDGPYMGTLVSPTGARMMIEHQTVDYYDGSEEFFEREELQANEADTVVTWYGGGIKTIVEERLATEPHEHLAMAPTDQVNTDTPVSDIDGRAELPASPVPVRRFTREFVHSVLYDKQSSTDTDSSGLPNLKTSLESTPQRGEKVVTGPGMEAPILEKRDKGLDLGGNNDTSMMSHADTSLMESSTVELAIRFSSPGVNNAAPASEHITTEDGMSELLDGYQHTEVKEDSEMVDVKTETPEHQAAEKRGAHTPGHSSDQQSFKSCTDLPEEPYKDSDAKSFRTCKDAVTPDRAVSMPASRVPSSILKTDSATQRPVSEMPLSSPVTVVRKKHHKLLRSSSSFHIVGNRIRANSKLSSRNASTVTSVGSSVDAGTQQHPIVPPRESSVSKEAERNKAVASYLMRLRHAPFSFTKGRGRSEASPRPSVSGDLVPAQDAENREANANRPSFQGAQDDLDPRGKAHGGCKASLDEAHDPSSNDMGGPTASSPGRFVPTHVTPSNHRAQRTPSAPVPPASSVYSSNNNSSSSKGRTLSSPPEFSNSPEQNRRDSHSTTHLVWPSRRSMQLRSSTTPERVHRSSEQEDTTTDLRLSAYRHPLQMHYLPDLKEESHEDSSLNTSASNLKNSTFRFPHGGQPSVRASVEDGRLVGRNPSMRSARNSSLMQTRGLPSMNFSSVDLIADLNGYLVEPRTTRSFDAEERDGLVRDGLLRSASDGLMRDKYRSLFSPLEGSEKMVDRTQTADELAAIRRRYTTKDLMSDIENLDVPSVNGLTLRLSEWLPELRGSNRGNTGGEPIQEDAIIGQVMEELQDVGKDVVVGVGVAMPAQKRSSARLRPVPGSPNMLVVDDAVYEELTSREKEAAEVKTGSKSGGSTEMNAGPQGKAPLAELEAPPAVKLRPRSLSLGEHRPSTRQSIRRSQLSLPSTPTATASTDTHPWQHDGNYPWTETAIPSIDISLPAPAALKGSPRPGPSPLRLRLSESSGSGLTPSHPARAAVHPAKGSGVASDGRLLGPGPKSRLDKGRNPSPSPPPFDTNGFPLGPLDIRNGDQSHEAGDRYPTSSLSPPSNVNLHALTQQPPARLSDSDDELASPRRRKLSLLPRFKSQRTSHACGTERKGFGDSSQSRDRHLEAESQGQQRPISHHSRRLTYTNASGLTSKEYHMAKLSNKLKAAWGKVTRACKRVFRREPSIEETLPVRRAGFPSGNARPQKLMEPHPSLAGSYYDYNDLPAPPAPKKVFGLFPKN